MPKIEFRYSDVYDRGYRESDFIRKHLEEKNQKYPSREEIINYTKKAERLWRKVENKILTEISKATKLKWKERRVICYVIGVGRPFSDPLTLRVFANDFDRFIDTLTHEMIHQIFIQNNKKYMKWSKYVSKTYTDEQRATKTHILLSAVHWKMFLKLFNKKRLDNEIKRYQRDIDYKRAWEIVEEETPNKILNKFYSIIK